MKLPSRNDLSAEQEQVFIEAPLNGTVIIVGPPGTGKTVLGIYRAKLLAKQGKPFDLVMYNRVLKQYTMQSLDDDVLKDQTRTWHSWIYSWWSAANKGGKWKMPELARMQPDFMAAMGLLGGVQNPKKLGWNHLIIDEGQDFPYQFYLLLNCVRANPIFHNGSVPALTVLADENQRLDHVRNSRIEQICIALGVSSSEVFRLRKNFRNTKQIAELARIFHTGQPEELAELPTRNGPKPTLVKFQTLKDEVEQIFRFAKNNDDLEIGVFVADQKTLGRVYDELVPLCGKAELILQSYSSRNKKDLPVFDQKGSITLLCDRSVKGVEFDAVFVPQLSQYRVDGVQIEFLKMNFYVVSTRARRHLQFSYTDSSGVPAVLKIFEAAGQDTLERKELTK